MRDHLQKLQVFLKKAAKATTVEIINYSLMSGGAIQENWSMDIRFEGGPFDGLQEVVMRKDSPSVLSVSLNRSQEFALLKAAFLANIKVPEPLFLGNKEDANPFDFAFFIMRRVQGHTAGFKIVKDDTLGGGRTELAKSLGRELAKIHAIDPRIPELSFLALPEKGPALDWIETFEAFLDSYHTPRPALYWGISWLKEHLPETGSLVLCHNDFRTGNYMVDAQGITGILDWEFTAWGDPLADIGWFCARCWRFGANDYEAGGIGSREDFYTGYEEISNLKINQKAVHYWEVMAALRWGVIALQQSERHISGQECNLELALTGHIVPELEYDILQMTQGA